MEQEEVLRIVKIGALMGAILLPMIFFEYLFSKDVVVKNRALRLLLLWIVLLIVLLSAAGIKLAVIGLCAGSSIGCSMWLISKIFKR